ncbi:MAG: hypothetical protein H0X18_11185 [Geodermatophilaceae bacterium]|nr:hypothetical protein [Geodermatophilaceae bacterium]
MLEAIAPNAGRLVQVLLIGTVTAAIGLVRFAALRAWVFSTTRRAAASVLPSRASPAGYPSRR